MQSLNHQEDKHHHDGDLHQYKQGIEVSDQVDAQYSIRETFFIRLVSSCAVLFASKVVEKL